MQTETIISSRQNSLCKQVRTLHHAKGRREHRLFLAEGRNSVEAALQSCWPIAKVLCSPQEATLWENHIPSGVHLQRVEPAILEYLSQAESNPGVIALCPIPTVQEMLSFQECLLVLDGVGDPGNVGTALRSADAVGAGGVICTVNSADPFSPKSVRSSAGSLFHSPPILLKENAPEAITAALKPQKIPLIIADANAEVSCFEYHWPRQCALVLGHETRGVSPEFENAATVRLKIPIYGRAESLNVAMAGTVLLYAWRNAQNNR